MSAVGRKADEVTVLFALPLFSPKRTSTYRPAVGSDARSWPRSDLCSVREPPFYFLSARYRSFLLVVTAPLSSLRPMLTRLQMARRR